MVLKLLRKIKELFFFFTFYFEITIDLHAIVGNNTEIPVPFIQCFPTVIFGRTIIQYQNQDMEIDKNPLVLLGFPSFPFTCVFACACVCSVQFCAFIPCTGLCVHHS